jgi:hypothetical protein
MTCLSNGKLQHFPFPNGPCGCQLLATKAPAFATTACPPRNSRSLWQSPPQIGPTRNLISICSSRPRRETRFAVLESENGSSTDHFVPGPHKKRVQLVIFHQGRIIWPILAVEFLQGIRCVGPITAKKRRFAISLEWTSQALVSCPEHRICP